MKRAGRRLQLRPARWSSEQMKEPTMSLHDFDVRDTLPDSDASTWSDYWDCHRWELGLEPGPSDVDRLGQAAETLERAAAFLDGLSPIAGGAPAEPSPADLI